MSLLSSGNEIPTHSHVFPMEESSQVGEARRFTLNLCNELDFDETQLGRVGIVVNELGTNLIKYATHGRLIFRHLRSENSLGLEILSVDQGPGFSNIERVLSDGFTTGTTPGTGLGAVQRLSDVFDIFSSPGKGTVLLSQIFARKSSAKSPHREGVICVPLRGEEVCGDGWITREKNGRIQAMVIDGLGHGPHANRAASEALEVFRSQENISLDLLMQSIHGRLKSTRGGAVFLAQTSLHDTVEFVGIGNVRAVIQTSEELKNLLSQNGTAGIQIRSSKVLSQPLPADGILILHSDGISSKWDLSQYPGILRKHPALIAAVIYRDFSRGNDDSTVLVVRREP